MSIPESPPGDTPTKPDEDKGASTAIELLQSEVRSLRLLFNITLLALIVLVLSLFGFMLREKKLVTQKIEENSRYVSDYRQKVQPRLAEFSAKLYAYSKLHTNFAPVLAKYFGATNLPSGLGMTSSIPTAPTAGLGTPAQPP